MKDGFVTVACGTPKLRLADCRYGWLVKEKAAV